MLNFLDLVNMPITYNEEYPVFVYEEAPEYPS